MTTVYVRRYDLKESLSDAEVAAFWKWGIEEALPAIRKVKGTRSVKMYSGAGGLRADLRIVWEMDDAGVYEQALHDASLRSVIGRFYAGIDLRTSTQTFLREITPELVQAIGS